MGGYNIGEEKAEVLANMETVLTITFTAEAAIKIAVLGSRRYFRSRCVKKIKPISSQTGVGIPASTKKKKTQDEHNVNRSVPANSLLKPPTNHCRQSSGGQIHGAPSFSCDSR